MIGSHLIEVLAASGEYQVVGLNREPPAERPAGFHWISCDLTNDREVLSALHAVQKKHGDRISSVVHLAAHSDFSGRPSPLYRDLNVEGTRRLLRGLRSFTVEQFVYPSTMLVFKAGDREPLTEASGVEPEWDYPRSKLQAERVIAKERGDIPTVILRIAGVYDEACRSIPLAQQIRRIYEKQLESIVFPGDASHGQSFLHLEDLTRCIRRAIECRGQLDALETFVVGEEEVVSYEAFQEQIGELIHQTDWPTVRIPKSVAKAGAWMQQKAAPNEISQPFIKPWMIDLADEHYVLDTRATRKKLGWQPKNRLQDAIPYMVGQLIADPKNWYEENGLTMPAGMLLARDGG